MSSSFPFPDVRLTKLQDLNGRLQNLEALHVQSPPHLSNQSVIAIEEVKLLCGTVQRVQCAMNGVFERCKMVLNHQPLISTAKFTLFFDTLSESLEKIVDDMDILAEKAFAQHSSIHNGVHGSNQKTITIDDDDNMMRGPGDEKSKIEDDNDFASSRRALTSLNQSIPSASTTTTSLSSTSLIGIAPPTKNPKIGETSDRKGTENDLISTRPRTRATVFTPMYRQNDAAATAAANSSSTSPTRPALSTPSTSAILSRASTSSISSSSSFPSSISSTSSSSSMLSSDFLSGIRDWDSNLVSRLGMDFWSDAEVTDAIQHVFRVALENDSITQFLETTKNSFAANYQAVKNDYRPLEMKELLAFLSENLRDSSDATRLRYVLLAVMKRMKGAKKSELNPDERMTMFMVILYMYLHAYYRDQMKCKCDVDLASVGLQDPSTVHFHFKRKNRPEQNKRITLEIFKSIKEVCPAVLQEAVSRFAVPLFLCAGCYRNLVVGKKRKSTANAPCGNETSVNNMSVNEITMNERSVNQKKSVKKTSASNAMEDSKLIWIQPPH